MFEYKCEKCNNIWYVNDNVKKNVKVCPFCIQQVPKKEFVIVVDCFQNAVKKVDENAFIIVTTAGTIRGKGFVNKH